MTWKGFRRRSFILPMALLVVWCAKATAQRIPEKMQEALNRLSSGDIEGARSLLEEIIRENPRHGPARLQLGQLALERGLVDEAREHLQVATTSNPRRLFLAWHLLGRVFRLQGQDGRARECFQESLARAPHFLPPRLFLIEIAEEGGDRWEALAHYRKILEQRPSVPELPDILAGMAQLARSMGALELAECSLRPSLEAQPNNGFFHYLLGLILSESGRVEEALASCLRAVELGFRKAPVYVTLGNLYYQKMLLSESIAALGQAVERDPAAAETLASFALTSLTTEEYRALRSLLEKHVEAHPESLNTLYGLGAMYLREGDLAKAKELFQRLEKLVPQHSQVHYNLGLIHLRQGDETAGKAAMERFRELKAAEDTEWLRHNRAHRKRLEARDAFSHGEADASIRLYRELIAEGTAETDDALALGRAYLSVRRNAEALATFESILRSDPYHRDALQGLAQAAEGLGRNELAQQHRARVALITSPCAEKP